MVSFFPFSHPLLFHRSRSWYSPRRRTSTRRPRPRSSNISGVTHWTWRPSSASLTPWVDAQLGDFWSICAPYNLEKRKQHFSVTSSSGLSRHMLVPSSPTTRSSTTWLTPPTSSLQQFLKLLHPSQQHLLPRPLLKSRPFHSLRSRQRTASAGSIPGSGKGRSIAPRPTRAR